MRGKIMKQEPTVSYIQQTKQIEDQVIEEAKAILYRRLVNENQELTSPTTVRNFLQLELAEEEREVFAVIFLDTRHKVIAFDRLFYGTIDGASVYPREVAKAALQHNAAAMILAHNHPSGNPQPSEADKRLTKRLVAAMELLDIRVLDHFIVGEGRPVSFAEHGLL